MPNVTGLNSTVLKSKLVQADKLREHTIVYLASLREEKKQVWDHFCAAYFVNTNCFLTTGRCIEKLKEKKAFDSSKVRIHLESQGKENLIDYMILSYDKLDEYNDMHKKDKHDIPNFDLGLIKVSKIFSNANESLEMNFEYKYFSKFKLQTNIVALTAFQWL